MAKSRRKMLGMDFEKEFKEEQEQMGHLVIKFPDTRQISGLIQKAIGSHNFIAQKVPCDFIVIERGGKVTFIELKRTACVSFPIINVKEHQVTKMCEIEHYGALAYFIINFYKRERYARDPIRDIKCQIKPSRLKELITTAKAMGRASIPMQWMIYGKENIVKNSEVETKWQELKDTPGISNTDFEAEKDSIGETGSECNPVQELRVE